MATPTSPGIVSEVKLSNINYIDTLIVGKKWGGRTGTGVELTYSFGNSKSRYELNYGFQESDRDFNSFTESEKQATIEALATISEVANIKFTLVEDSETVAGDIRFAKTRDPNSWGRAYYPNNTAKAGDVWVSNEFADSDDWSKGTYGNFSLIHEITHALGLKHPHEIITKKGFNSGGIAEENIDIRAYTIMSYRSSVGASLDGTSGQTFYPTTLMIHDIAALQYLYGANMETRKGDNVYQWTPGEKILETIWDSGGIDTIDWSNQSLGGKINLNPGEWSELGEGYLPFNREEFLDREKRTLNIAYGVIIENAIGGNGRDEIIGNKIPNLIYGKKGNDTIDGYRGEDTINGNGGNDYIEGNFGKDILIGSKGKDTLLGGSGNDNLNGGEDKDTLKGGMGQDTLMGANGDDILVGYKGKDSLLGGSGNDNLNGGNDLDTLFGGEGSDTLFGGGGRDTLRGGKGDDILIGGTGIDYLVGGFGRDIFAIELLSQNTISDFVDGVDKLFLSNGIIFSELSIVSNHTNTATLINKESQTLAILLGVDPGWIDFNDFV